MESPTTILAAAHLASAAPPRGRDTYRARRARRSASRDLAHRAIALMCAVAAVALASLAVSSGTALAAAGDLDPSFDGDGKAVLPFYGQPQRGAGAAGREDRGRRDGPRR